MKKGTFSKRIAVLGKPIILMNELNEKFSLEDSVSIKKKGSNLWIKIES